VDLSRVTVILPALNEAAALPSALASFPPQVRLLVVDNGSTDQTAAVAAAHGAQVVREPRRGFGAACWAGVQAAPGDVLVLRGEADLVVGSRMARRAPGAMSALAVLENRLLGLACRLLFGVPLTDLGPFRAIRRDVLLALGVTDRGSGWPLEMIGRAGRLGLRVVEVPVRYRPRAGGRSKVSGSVGGTVRASIAMAAVTLALLRERRWTRAAG
jgi:glycosyltransferase involved in cell wall biosynthesis